MGSDMLIWMCRKPTRDLTDAEWDEAIELGLMRYDSVEDLDALLGEDGIHNEEWLKAFDMYDPKQPDEAKVLLSGGRHVLRKALSSAVKVVLHSREVTTVDLSCPCCDQRTTWLVSGGLESWGDPISIASDMQLLSEVDIASWVKSPSEHIADIGKTREEP